MAELPAGIGSPELNPELERFRDIIFQLWQPTPDLGEIYRRTQQEFRPELPFPFSNADSDRMLLLQEPIGLGLLPEESETAPLLGSPSEEPLLDFDTELLVPLSDLRFYGDLLRDWDTELPANFTTRLLPNFNTGMPLTIREELLGAILPPNPDPEVLRPEPDPVVMPPADPDPVIKVIDLMKDGMVEFDYENIDSGGGQPNALHEDVAAAPALPEENSSEQRETSLEPQEEESPEQQDSFSDSDSLLNDLMLGAEAEEDEVDSYQGDKCSEQEALIYRERLHLVGPEEFVRETIVAGTISAKKLLTAFNILPPPCFEGSPDERYLRLLGLAIMEELMRRKKLSQYNNIDDAVDLLKKSNKILVITGAGISTNLGIPDFRSKDTGFYEKMREKGFASGEEVFDIHLFNDDPTQFYDNCGDTFPSQGVTTPTHAFIALLQSKGKLLTNYTQNIDNIEASAGIDKDKLVQCHGSWATATCQKCRFKVPGQEIIEAVKRRQVPRCERCIEDLKHDSGPKKRKRKVRKNWNDYDDDDSDDSDYDIPEPGVMKPDITFFGEALPDTFFNRFNNYDKAAADLAIVIGTSMKVAPVSEIPMALPPSVPHIYISREPCRHIGFDISLLGDCDVTVAELAKRIGWDLQHSMLPQDHETVISLEDEEKAIWRLVQKAKEPKSPV